MNAFEIAICSAPILPLAIGIVGMFLDSRKKHWPITQGNIEKATFKATNPGLAAHLNPSYIYRFLIQYNYKVNNQTFQGFCKLPMSQSVTSESDARQAIDTIYATGQTIDILFNPQKPSCSTLHHKVRQFWFNFVYVGIVLLIPALNILLQRILN